MWNTVQVLLAFQIIVQNSVLNSPFLFLCVQALIYQVRFDLCLIIYLLIRTKIFTLDLLDNELSGLESLFSEFP